MSRRGPRGRQLATAAMALLLAASVTAPGAAGAQAPRLRPTPEMFTRELARVGTERGRVRASSWRHEGMSPITQGMLLGGGIGLGATALLSVLYIQSSETRDYSSMGLPVLIGTALGAMLGAAIGAGFER